MGGQCIVNIVDKSCTCRRWEITGLPCKNVVATNWNMALNRQQVGAVETWAHTCYHLNTWKETYKHHVEPITSNKYWENQLCQQQLFHRNMKQTRLPQEVEKELG